MAKLAAFDDQLGLTPDSQIAILASVTPQTVARYRRSKNISSYRQRRDAPVAPTGTAAPEVESEAATPEAALPVPTISAPDSNLAAYAGLIGKVTDMEVAQIAGVTLEEVERHRNEESAPEPAAELSSAINITDADRELYVYQVQLEEEEFFAIAHDLVDLAAKMQSQGYEAHQLKRLGTIRV